MDRFIVDLKNEDISKHYVVSSQDLKTANEWANRQAEQLKIKDKWLKIDVKKFK